MDDAVRKYWQDTLDELASYPARPEFDVLPIRSTPFATLYSVRFTSLGPYRLFGYLSIPTGTGPFPAIYYPPKYQSVLEIIPQGTANLQRSRYITFSLAGRGQRNADTPFAAMFPGLLTEGIDNAASYAFRGIVADSVRGLEFLLTRRELDAARVVLVGNDVALIAAALTAGATHVVTTPALFYKTAEPRRDQRLCPHVPGACRGGPTDARLLRPARLRAASHRHHAADGRRARHAARRAGPRAIGRRAEGARHGPRVRAIHL